MHPDGSADRFRTRAIGAFLLLAGLYSTGAIAQDYPARPITVVVPFAAGGPTDVLGRNLAVAMSSVLKQQVVIVNHGGAGGTIGTAKVAKAAPDGYTVLLMHVGIATAPALYRALPYDTLNDFEPIGRVADVPMTLVARKSLAPDNLQEFLTYAKANKEKLTYANAGPGSSSHLCGLQFMSAIGTEFTTVPYKGNAPAMVDLLGGQIDFLCDQTTNTTEQIKANTIKVYGVTSKTRVPSLPSVPTLDEQGMKGFEVVIWYGLWVPAGTPIPVRDTLGRSLRAALQDQTFNARLADLGAVPASLAEASPESLRAFLAAEVASWGAIIRKSGAYAN